MEPQTEISMKSGWFEKNSPEGYIFNNTDTPILLIQNNSDIILDINKGMFRFLGYDAGNLPDCSLHTILVDAGSFFSSIAEKETESQSPELNLCIDFITSTGESKSADVKVMKMAKDELEYLMLVISSRGQIIPAEVLAPEKNAYLENLKAEVTKQLSMNSDAISRRDDRFSAILEQIPLLVLALDKDEKLLYVNSKWEKFLGYSLIDLSQNGFASKVYAEDIQKYQKLFSSCVDKPELIRLVDKTGDTVDTIISVTSFEIADDITVKLLIVDSLTRQNTFLEKIESEKNNAEAKIDDLRQMLELSNSVIDQSPDIILVYDENGKLLRYSKNSALLNQYSFDELNVLKNLPFISEADRSEFRKYVFDDNEGSSGRLEIKLSDKAGNGYYSLLNIKKLTGLSGKGNLKFLFFTDISKYKKEEESSEINCSINLFDVYPDMILLHDATGNIIDANKLLVEKLGYPKNELLSFAVSALGLQPGISIDENEEYDPATKLKLVSRMKMKNGDELDVKADSNIVEYNGRRIIMTVLKETTSQKQKYIESRLLESSLGQLLQFMNVGIIIFNQNGYITHLSDNCETLTGIMGEEWENSGLFLVERIAREDYVIFRQNIERVFKGEILKDILIGFKNSEEVKTELKGSFLPVMEDGGVSEVILILQEYTKFDRETRISNFHEIILNSAPVGIITFDTQGNYTSVNEEFLKMLGYEFTREEVLNWNLYSLMDKDKILPGFVTALKGETVDYTRDYMPTPSTQKYSFYQSFAPLKDKEGTIIGVLGLLNEITDKTIIPQNVIEAEEKYRKIYDSLEECVLLFKPTGGIMNANRGSFALLGEPVLDIIKKSITDYFVDTESDEFADFMFNLHSFGDSAISTKIKKEDGSVFEADVYGKGFEISGLQRFILVIKKTPATDSSREPEISGILPALQEAVKESNGIDSFNFLKEFDEGIVIADSEIRETIFINEKIKEMFAVSIEDFHSRGIIPVISGKMTDNSKYFFKKNVELCRSSQLGIRPFEVEFPENDGLSQNVKVEIFNFTSKILGKDLKYIKLTPVKNIRFAEDEEDSIKSRYYKYFEYLPLPCAIINAEGVILDLNPPLNEALQFGYSDMVNKKLDPFFAQDSDRISSFLKLHKNFQHLNEQSDLKIRRRDGSLVDCRIFYTKIEDDIFLVFLHFTNLQRYLPTSVTGGESNFTDRLSSIQEITGEISMGFSSFVYLIDGYTEFLSKSRELSNQEKQRLQQLLLLIQKVHAFVEKLLVFSERKYLEQDEFDILPILNKSARETLSGFISYKLDIPEEKILVRGNPDSVLSMFCDTLGFIKSSISGDGEIEINAKIDSNPSEKNGLGIATENKFLLISIKESGFRIPGDILPRIFEPFVASKDISKCDIGLSFGYGVIKSLGGMISIEDDEKFDHKINMIIPLFTTD